MSHPPAATIDLLPAGASDSHGKGHHGHTIVPMRLLVTVLATLMFFTLLTVLAANAEEFYSRMFHVQIPAWVNVAVALSIGAIKSIIVALYFMQLRYDSPVNALVAVFTIMVLTFFLGFTMLDLGSRGMIDEYKGRQVIYGGFGEIEVTAWEKDPQSGEKKMVKKTIQNMSIAAFARQEADRSIEESLSKGEKIESHAYQTRLLILRNELAALPAVPADKVDLFKRMNAYIEANAHEFEHIAHELAKTSHAEEHAGPGHHAESTANYSRTRTGLTPGLFDDTAPATHAPESHGAH